MRASTRGKLTSGRGARVAFTAAGLGVGVVAMLAGPTTAQQPEEHMSPHADRQRMHCPPWRAGVCTSQHGLVTLKVLGEGPQAGLAYPFVSDRGVTSRRVSRRCRWRSPVRAYELAKEVGLPAEEVLTIGGRVERSGVAERLRGGDSVASVAALLGDRRVVFSSPFGR